MESLYHTIMNNLLFSNTCVIGMLAVAWNRENWLNFVIKCGLLVLTIFNIIKLSKGM